MKSLHAKSRCKVLRSRINRPIKDPKECRERQEAYSAHEYNIEIKVITIEKSDDVSSWRHDDVVIVAYPWR